MKTKILLFLTLSFLMGTHVQAQQIEWKTIEQAAKTDAKPNSILLTSTPHGVDGARRWIAKPSPTQLSHSS